MSAIFIHHLMGAPGKGVAYGGPMAHFFVVELLFWEAMRACVTGDQPLLSRRSGFLVNTNSIVQMIEPSLVAMGYRLVRVVMTSGRRSTLQVMAERLDDVPITFDDCTRISHSVSS